MATEDVSFAERLKSLRETAGITQYELAARAGLSRQALSHLEAGKREPTWATVQAIAKALGVSCDDFNKADDVAKEAEQSPPAPAGDVKPKRGRGRPRKDTGEEGSAE